MDTFLKRGLSKLSKLINGLVQLKSALKSLEIISSDSYISIFDQWYAEIFNYFLERFGNNIVRYIGQISSLSLDFQNIACKQIAVLHGIISKRELGMNELPELRLLLKSVPFFKELSSTKDLLIAKILKFAINGSIKELDLATRGKAESYLGYDFPTSTVRNACNWIIVELGIAPSNKMYSLM
jgi:hypothetical protein